MRVALASDHRGYGLKQEVKEILTKLGHTFEDFGSHGEDPADYPDFGFRAAEAVAQGGCDRAILLCHSGIGMSIVANKVNGIRAALCCDPDSVELSRHHNDANVLVLPAKTGFDDALPGIIQRWLELPFEGGRHKRRLEKISRYEADRGKASSTVQHPSGKGA